MGEVLRRSKLGGSRHRASCQCLKGGLSWLEDKGERQADSDSDFCCISVLTEVRSECGVTGSHVLERLYKGSSGLF